MSGLTPLVDTLLATRLAQRIDLLPLKAELEIASPGAVTQVEKVTNDLRLPSRAAMQQQLGVGLLKSGASGHDHGHGHGQARSGESVTLSGAARAVSAILNSQTGATAKIVGTQPLWAQAQPALAPLLAATLASTVANSGLFYESHLVQYAAGTRTLAQLAQEPQAHLVVVPSDADAAVSTAPDGTLVPARARAPGEDLGGLATLAKEAGPGSTDGMRNHSPVVTAALVADAIHPDAMPLVRQQLELLTLPLFRWTGEAWPGAPMDWEIHEEQDARQAMAEPEAVAGAWTTRLAMRLPALGAVDVRLTLAGSTLQVHLAAREPATVALLTGGGNALPQRFGALGLQLTGLRIGALADAPLAES